MNDKEFKEEFKPIQIPVQYNCHADWEEKTIYALAQINEGSAEDVSEKISELQPDIPSAEIKEHCSEILAGLFNKGLLKGRRTKDQMIYNLSKITTPNSGSVDPDLL